MPSEKDPPALAEITKDSDLNISEDTVGRPLREKGYYVKITAKHMALHAWIGHPVPQTSTQSKMWGLYLKLACGNDNWILPTFLIQRGVFVQAAQEEWGMLDWDAAGRSIDSMNKRLQQVLSKNGGHTKF
jgi:hypothetical protein